MSERNIFNDKILDVNSLDDLRNEYNVNLLYKKDKTILFELADDFWEFNYETKELYQYTDYLSMQEDEQKNLVFSTKNPSINKDYGESVALSLLNNDLIPQIADFTLEDRDSYIKSEIKAMKASVSFNGKDLQQSHSVLKNEIDKHIKFQAREFQDVQELTATMLKTLAFMFAFFKAVKIQASKRGLIDDIITQLNSGKKEDIIRNKDLHKEVPELPNLVQKYDKFFASLSLEKNPKILKAQLNEHLDTVLQDQDLLSATEKVANSQTFKNKIIPTMEEYTKLVDEIKASLPTEFLENFNSDEKKAQILEKLQVMSGEEWSDLLYNDLNIKPNAFDDRLNHFTSTVIIDNLLKGQPLNQYDTSVIKMIEETDDLNLINKDKVSDIITGIIEHTLGLSQNNQSKIKI